MIEVGLLALTSPLMSYLLFDYQSIKIYSMDCAPSRTRSLCLLFLVLILIWLSVARTKITIFSGQIYVDIINIKNADMVRSIREANSSGKCILDTQKDKRQDRRQRDMCLKLCYENSILSGPEKSICSRWEKQKCMSASQLMK